MALTVDVIEQLAAELDAAHQERREIVKITENQPALD